MKKVVSYVRVSTARQGRSGLGLEAQRQAVAEYLAQTGARLVGEYLEIESAADNRPELAAALAHCRRTRASLVVAKLDRLSRNVAFLAALLEADVPFVACDNPTANKLTLHLLAAVAEHEREAISQRTRDALAAAKRRGVALGGENPACRNLSAAARRRGWQRSAEARRRAAEARYADLRPLVAELREEGRSLAAVAEELNRRGYETARGCAWTGMAVSRVLAAAS